MALDNKNFHLVVLNKMYTSVTVVQGKGAYLTENFILVALRKAVFSLVALKKSSNPDCWF